MQRYLRLRDVVGYVKISRSSIYRLLQKGEFPKPVKFGEKILLWDRVEIDKWIMSKRKEREEKNLKKVGK